MSDHYDRYNGMEELLGTNLAEVGTDVHDINVGELISRQAAIDAVKRLSLGETDAVRLAMRIGYYLERLQSAQPKRGKWVKDKGQQTLMQNFIERGEVWRVCSVCGAGHMIGHQYAIDKAYHDRHHNYCPNCGAKMEAEE